MINWFKKKEFSIDDCVPVNIKEVEDQKIQAVKQRVQQADIINTKMFRQVATNLMFFILEKFVYEEDTSYPVMAKLVKKLKDAGL